MAMVITNEGKTRLLKKMCQLDLNGFLIAIGAGTTPPTVYDTSLESEIKKLSPVYVEVIDNILYISAFFDTTISGAVNEVGLLDATDNMLISREVLNSTITKNSDNTLTVDIQIEI